MGSVSDWRRNNNREFFEFSGEKQASDRALAMFPWKFNRCSSGLGGHQGRFLLLRKTGH
jgi:hypothetical protein